MVMSCIAWIANALAPETHWVAMTNLYIWSWWARLQDHWDNRNSKIQISHLVSWMIYTSLYLALFVGTHIFWQLDLLCDMIQVGDIFRCCHARDKELKISHKESKIIGGYRKVGMMGEDVDQLHKGCFHSSRFYKSIIVRWWSLTKSRVSYLTCAW